MAARRMFFLSLQFVTVGTLCILEYALFGLDGIFHDNRGFVS
jgi:hypothetical protein